MRKKMWNIDGYVPKLIVADIFTPIWNNDHSLYENIFTNHKKSETM